MSVSSTSAAAGACATALGLNPWWMVSKVHRTWGSDLVVATAARGRSTAGAVLFLAALVGTLGVAWPDAAGAATLRVSAGETLSQIAPTYGTTTSQGAAANDITDSNKIEAGTVLQIPTSGSGTSMGSASVGSTSVAVRPGESLWDIATRFGTTVSALAAANGIINTAHVLIGATLVVPAGEPSPASAIPGTASKPISIFPAALTARPDRQTLIPLFSHWAAYFGIPASLLEGMCWWESGWQTGAVSSTGAIGVGQLEPATVSTVRDELGDRSLDPANTSDNIEMAAYYLHQLIVRSAGSERLGLASYYQGLTSVRHKGMLRSTVVYVNGVLATSKLFA